MIVTIDEAGRARLEDVDDFRAFKVLRRGGARAEAPRELGRLDGDHLWVARAWLEQNGRPADEAWRSGLQKMIDYAASQGWVDGAGAIRAHIESV